MDDITNIYSIMVLDVRIVLLGFFYTQVGCYITTESLLHHDNNNFCFGKVLNFPIKSAVQTEHGFVWPIDCSQL